MVSFRLGLLFGAFGLNALNHFFNGVFFALVAALTDAAPLKEARRLAAGKGV